MPEPTEKDKLIATLAAPMLAKLLDGDTYGWFDWQQEDPPVNGLTIRKINDSMRMAHSLLEKVMQDNIRRDQRG